jgi:hypothetical protein
MEYTREATSCMLSRVHAIQSETLAAEQSMLCNTPCGHWEPRTPVNTLLAFLSPKLSSKYVAVVAKDGVRGSGVRQLLGYVQ